MTQNPKDKPSFAYGLHLALLIFFLAPVLVVVLALINELTSHPPMLSHLVDFLTACPRKTLMNQPCPLCGATTAAILALQGEFNLSLKTNPLALGIFPLVAVQIAYRLVVIRRQRSILVLEISSWLVPAIWFAIVWLVLA